MAELESMWLLSAQKGEAAHSGANPRVRRLGPGGVLGPLFPLTLVIFLGPASVVSGFPRVT